jgi:hypothetical protein
MNKYTLIAAMTMGVLAGCTPDVQNAGDIPSGASTGTVAVRLGGDSNMDGNDGEVSSSIEEVGIRLEDVQVHHESEGWISILSEREDIDLLALRGTPSGDVVGKADVYEGAYDELKLVVADSWIVVDGVEADLTITSGLALPGEEGLNFDESYYVDEGQTTTLWVGWDLDTQLSHGDDGWVLGSDANLDVNLHE